MLSHDRCCATVSWSVGAVRHDKLRLRTQNSLLCSHSRPNSVASYRVQRQLGIVESRHLQATVDADSGRIVVVSALDNLGKGAAGQAVQCANIMSGLPETTGLSVYGVAP